MRIKLPQSAICDLSRTGSSCNVYRGPGLSRNPLTTLPNKILVDY